MYSPYSLKIKNIISHVDSEYRFKNGTAIIVVGINHDDTSQLGNGSGKSALIESLALAFTGTSIRDVKVKELINRQAKDGEVELVLNNSKDKRELKIWRKIYSGTKPGECRIWLGEEEVRLSDINTYNKFIFDEIGLSKEDFFNFYLLVQANYEPFLRVGDTKKKEIINRFSGADSVDQLIPLVKQDCLTLSPEVERLQTDLTKEQVKYSLLEEGVEALNNKAETLDQDKQEKISIIQQKIVHLKNQIQFKNDIVIANQSTITDQQNQLTLLNKDADQLINNNEIATLNKQKDELEQKNIESQSQIKLVQNDFAKEVGGIQTKQQDVVSKIEALKQDITDFEQLESDINKQVQDSIQCPACEHKFSIRNQEFNYNEAITQLPLIIEELVSMKDDLAKLNHTLNVDIFNEKQAVNGKIIQKQNAIKQQVTINNEQIISINNQIQQLNQKNIQLDNAERLLNNAIIAANNTIATTNQTIESLKTQQVGLLQEIEDIKQYTTQKEIQDLQEKQITSLELQQQIKTHLDVANLNLSEVAQWEINFKNFKSFVANQSIKNIQDYTNLFLQQMGSNLNIHLDGFSILASGKLKEQISVEVLRNGFNEGSYGAFSGGERGRIDICCILAIQQLINLNCKSGGLDLLICDEILDQIDTLGLESIINSLQNLDRTIMVVSQNEINTLKDYTLTIEKRNKISTFVN